VARLISFHSFRGGTGKSNITANVATAVAQAGYRVGVVDTDIQSPGIHTIFRLDEGQIHRTLNDYLWGRCAAEETAYDVSRRLGLQTGRLFLVPSSMDMWDISRVLHEGYDARQLRDGFKTLIRTLDLDYLLIDTHPGLNEETLLSIAISHILVVILRPDAQDYQGTSVTLEVARKLSVPRIYLVLNKVLPDLDARALQRVVEERYRTPIGAILPLCEELVRLGSEGVFLLQQPNHPFSQRIRELAETILGPAESPQP